MPTLFIPPSHDGDFLSYVLSFSDNFKRYQILKGCLDSVADNIEQAELLVDRPLGLFACITAEEEASRFFYFCLKQVGYNLPRYDKLTAHQDKIRVFLWGIIFEKYYFGIFDSSLKIFIQKYTK